MMWRAYVKDITELASTPKAFMKVDENNIEIDTLTSSTSSITAINVPSNVNIGDVIVLHNPYGKVRYKGIIQAIEGNTLECGSIWKIFADSVPYQPIPSLTIGSGYGKNWNMSLYLYDGDYPTPYDCAQTDKVYSMTISNNDIYQMLAEGAPNMTMKATTYVKFNNTRTYSGYNQLVFWAYRSGTIWINGELVSTSMIVEDGSTYTGYSTFSYTFEGGKVYQIDVCINTKNEPNFTFLLGTGQSEATWQPFSADTMVTTATHHLEQSIVETLKRFCSGKVAGSSYVDTLRALELGNITITNTTDNVGKLELKKYNSVINLEDWIYQLFEIYDILVDIDIPFEGNPSITVFKPNFDMLKIGNNSSVFRDISPITKVEETNKLIIYTSKGVYRATYVSKSDGTYAKEPSSYANRFEKINTKVVYSDEEETDICNSNLPKNFYNHKLSFTLRLNNNTYKYDDFKLGMPLQVYNNDEYYNTILTGISFTKEKNMEVTSVTYTCGKVRTALTKKLLLGVLNNAR